MDWKNRIEIKVFSPIILNRKEIYKGYVGPLALYDSRNNSNECS